MGDKASQSNPAEQYILLAKQAKGAAAVQLVKQVLEAPEVYVFGELLDMPNITDVSGLAICEYICMYYPFTC